jgi:hypothetical protein
MVGRGIETMAEKQPKLINERLATKGNFDRRRFTNALFYP